jgi:putative hydrolase of the HAD superfamily
MIKAIIFDYGNVISLPQTDEPTKQMEKLTGVPAKIFGTVYDRFRTGFDRGDYDGATMYSMLMEAEGYTDLAKDTELMKKIACIDMVNWQYVNEDVVRWTQGLQMRGFKLGILSNIPTEFLEHYENNIVPFQTADYACFSCRVKLIKPERAIYENVLTGLCVLPHEAVFFDDLKENIAAANEAGIHGCLWTGLETAKDDLRALLKSNAKKV